MTKYFDPKSSGFYDSEIYPNIPSTAIEISKAEFISLMQSQSNGGVISVNSNGAVVVTNKVFTNEELISIYEAAAQDNLDLVAKSWGYDSLISASSYLFSTNAQYKADAEALIAWRDSYWAEAYTIEQGTLPDTAEAFVAMLPTPPNKPIV